MTATITTAAPAVPTTTALDRLEALAGRWEKILAAIGIDVGQFLVNDVPGLAAAAELGETLAGAGALVPETALAGAAGEAVGEALEAPSAPAVTTAAEAVKAAY